MNKTWSVVLIILACLGVVSGTYWYFVMRPEPSTTSQVPQIQPPVQPEPALVAAQTPSLPPVAETPEQQEPKQEEAVIVNQPEPIVEVTIEQPALAPIPPLPPPVAPLLVSGLLKLPTPSASSVPIPFALAKPLVQAMAKVEPMEVSQPSEEERAPLQEILGQPLAEPSEVPPQVQPSQEQPPLEPEKESGKVVLTPSPPKAPAIPTTRVQIDPKPLSWTIGTAISFTNLDLSTKSNTGFSFAVDVLKHTDSLFSFGGALEYGQVNGDSYLSVLAKGQWTFRKERSFSLPVSVSLGPTFILGTSTEFGLSAKVLGGFSYEIVKNMRFFYQGGIQAQWVLTKSDFTLSLEPMHIGFSYSF